MDTAFVNEKLLLADIERLRGQFPNTQDLYREVCILLFFRYGITPTANRLYQLVRKGSMTAPAEALNRFWEDLREKSRVRIEHPDLPDSLKAAAGELTAALWTNAQTLAREDFVSMRSEAEASIEIAHAEKALAIHEREEVVRALQDARQRISVLEADLKQASVQAQVLHEKYENAVHELHQSKLALLEREAGVSTETERLRGSLLLSEEKLRASESIAVQERERLEAERSRSEAQAQCLRAQVSEIEILHRAQLQEANAQIAYLRQRFAAQDVGKERIVNSDEVPVHGSSDNEPNSAIAAGKLESDTVGVAVSKTRVRRSANSGIRNDSTLST